MNANPARPDGRISFVTGDITRLAVDAVVNAARPSLLGGGGVDGAIHRAAGPGLLAECRKLDGCATGEARITGAYLLPAKYVIHTVGPVYEAGQPACERLLRACYRNSLELAKAYGVRSIAFPAISTGAYGYPKREAAAVALGAVGEWLAANPDCEIAVILVCRDDAMRRCYQDALERA